VPGDAVPADRAVVDRIVDGATAVLLVGPDEWAAHVDAGVLPGGASDGTWLVVDPTTSPVDVLGVDEELTRRRADDISVRMRRMRERRQGGRFER
jgi:hypothetical protein